MNYDSKGRPRNQNNENKMFNLSSANKTYAERNSNLMEDQKVL